MIARRTFLRDLTKSLLWLPVAPAIIKAQNVFPGRRRSLGANLDPVATDWANRVVTNGGTLPSTAYQTAVSDLVAGLKTDSIWTKMVFVLGFVPGPVYGTNPPAANCWAPATPILVGPIIDPITYTSGSTYASTWPSDGHSNISLSGMNNVKSTLGATALAIWSGTYGCSATNMGIAFYSPDSSYNSGSAAFGADDYNNTHRFRVRLNSSSTSILDFGGNDLSPNLAESGGLYSFNRSATNSLNVHFGSSTVSPATIYTNTTTDTNDPRASAFNFWILGEDNPAGGCCDWGFNCSFCAGHQALSLSEFTLLYNRVQTFRTATGGGFA